MRSLHTGQIASLGYSSLYCKDAQWGDARDESTFLKYRASALRRHEIRSELGLDTAEKLAGLELRREQVLRAYDLAVQRESESSGSVELPMDLAATGS